jgi:nucleoid-associated protein YgaU
VIGSAPVADTDEVVVHRGDCLWSIVARSLGPTAEDADIARAWPRWYAANRSRIGTDAGLLLPGQRLVPPPPAS